MTIYESMRDACKRKGTNISTALRSTGHSNGNVGAWKTGSAPRVDICIDVAGYLGVTLDELVFGERAQARILDSDEAECVEIFRRIPTDKRRMCLDFLRTHMVLPEKFQSKMNA